MLKKIIHKIALTCKEATFLIELEDSNNISFFQKKRLSLHLKICKYCRIYQKKRSLLIQYFRKNEKLVDSQEIDALKLDKLKDKINKTLLNNID